MGAAAIRIRSTGIAHWKEQEVGCISSILIINDALESAQRGALIAQAQMIMGYQGIDKPRPGGEIRIVSLQVLH
ncbi:hypothetical protein AOG23_35005 [Rhizobium acidisoli]|nr:hypothetical protein AOG23_35005 [Rhizobium acidisoli]